MGIIDYIRGNRRGREANSLEREAMDDPFLTDAMEGYEAVYGDHPDIVERLEVWVQDRASLRRQNRRRSLWSLGVAASVVVAAGLGAVYMFTQNNPQRGVTMAELIAEEVQVVEVRPEELGLAPYVRGKAGGADPQAGMIAAVLPPEVAGKQQVSARVMAAQANAPQDQLIAQEIVEGEKRSLSQPPASDNSVVRSTAGQGSTARRDTVSYAPFNDYFAINHTDHYADLSTSNTRAQERSARLTGRVEVEFRVNEHGVPSAIQVISSFSRDANREVIDMLVRGPRWVPTDGERIRIIVEYE